MTYPYSTYQDLALSSPPPAGGGARGRLYTLGCSTRICEKNFQKSLLVMLKISVFEILKYYALKKIEFKMPYNSLTEHPGPLKVSMVSTLIFALVSKSVDRISKFALIKKLAIFFYIFQLFFLSKFF